MKISKLPIFTVIFNLYTVLIYNNGIMGEVGNKKDAQTKRLETIIGILLNQTNIQKMTMGEKIAYLSSQKYENQEIADMLGTTYSTVGKEKSKAKKKSDANG